MTTESGMRQGDFDAMRAALDAFSPALEDDEVTRTSDAGVEAAMVIAIQGGRVRMMRRDDDNYESLMGLCSSGYLSITGFGRELEMEPRILSAFKRATEART